MDFLSQSLGMFHKGGPVMYLLLLCSLAVVTIAVERFNYYRSMIINPHSFINRLQPLLERQRIAEAIQLCEQTPAVIGQLAAKGLQTYQHGGNIENSLTTTASLAAARMREYLNYLSTIVTLAPLFGLLGTVIGMIGSFSIFNIQSGQPMAITGGVGEALVATAAGLGVAAMALIVHSYFSHRLDSLITDIEQVSGLIINSLSQKRALRRENHEIA
ncbi:MotA/TolQ/ExbB proton channel family protein [Dendrosporobacter sp. 1207_IL3150]|uniref:MotA/TolQ/ExbB proton channel family protein n=1 Tax=Dendrosporobacter sp. 1207_IL3150 TaxID=3084054 RepID=UPI002FDB5C2A